MAISRIVQLKRDSYLIISQELINFKQSKDCKRGFFPVKTNNLVSVTCSVGVRRRVDSEHSLESKSEPEYTHTYTHVKTGYEKNK